MTELHGSPATSSLFEQEIADQIDAAEAALIEAVKGGDDLLEAAARNNLEDLTALARRNGLTISLSDLDTPASGAA